MHPTRSLIHPVPASALSVLAALSVLTACGSAKPEHRVATLRTPGSAGSMSAHSSAGRPAAARPRERLDMTPEDQTALWAAHDRCLADHGLGKNKAARAGGSAKVTAVRIDPKVEARAQAACLSRKPLPPWEYDTANPESLDFIHKMVQCLRGKGVRYVDEVRAGAGDDRNGFSFGGRNNDPGSISKGLQMAPVCEKELSVGGGRK